MKCDNTSNGFVHDLFPSVQCFGYPHIQAIIFGIFSLIFHFLSTVVILNCCYEHRVHSNCASARHKSFFQIALMLFTEGYMCLWIFTSSPWVFALYFLLAGAVQIFYFPKGPDYYYDESILSLTFFLWGFYLWCIIFPMISLLSDLANQQGILTFWLLGIPLVLYISKSLHMQKFVNFKREDIVADANSTIYYSKTLLYHLSSKMQNII